jgi:hypothetical protein
MTVMHAQRKRTELELRVARAFDIPHTRGLSRASPFPPLLVGHVVNHGFGACARDVQQM